MSTVKFGLNTEIKKILNEYTEETIEATNKGAIKAARRARKELKESAGTFKNLTGDYRKGWSVKKGEISTGIQSQIVHNRTDYRLTHLLEHGHLNRDGTSRTKSYPHIGPVEENSGQYFVDEVKKELKR